MTFDSKVLLDRLRALCPDSLPARWLVAFSGGIDSTVLLHALARATVAQRILAVHVNHGIHADAAEWEAHCRNFAAGLDVEYESRKVTIPDNPTHGPEAAARKARYDALLPLVGPDDCLLSAHHEDDQGETLLLNLIRGSGPAGLAGIGRQQSFGRGRLLRPLLGVSAEAIAAYARRHGLQWIEDPSNSDTRFDRNFLRADIMPGLAERWPAVSNRLRRSAELVGESSELLNDLAEIDLRQIGVPSKLSIAGLLALSGARQRNVLRRAVRLCGLPAPPATRLYQVMHELLPARIDAQPLVSWPGACVRRYQDHLYILPEQSEPPVQPDGILRNDGTCLRLSEGFGALELSLYDGAGIDPALAAEGVIVRYRTGGETIRIAAGGHTRKLKKLLQEEGIVPWMRDALPLLYAGERLIGVADLWLAADCVSSPGLRVNWIGRPALK